MNFESDFQLVMTFPQSLAGLIVCSWYVLIRRQRIESELGSASYSNQVVWKLIIIRSTLLCCVPNYCYRIMSYQHEWDVFHFVPCKTSISFETQMALGTKRQKIVYCFLRFISVRQACITPLMVIMIYGLSGLMMNMSFKKVTQDSSQHQWVWTICQNAKHRT